SPTCGRRCPTAKSNADPPSPSSAIRTRRTRYPLGSCMPCTRCTGERTERHAVIRLGSPHLPCSRRQLAFPKSRKTCPIPARPADRDGLASRTLSLVRTARMATSSPPTPDAASVRLDVRLGVVRSAVYEVGDGGFLIGSVPGCDLRLPGA